MTPDPTPASVIRNVAQALQALLDSAPDAPSLPVPRAWVERWLNGLAGALLLLERAEPTQREVLLAVGVLGFLVGMFVGWYSH